MKETAERDVTTYKWDDIPEEHLNELLTRKIITGDRTMISYLVKPLHDQLMRMFREK